MLQDARHDAKECLDAAISASGLMVATAISQAVPQQRQAHLVSLLAQRLVLGTIMVNLQAFSLVQ
jgi:hypothetical protein